MKSRAPLKTYARLERKTPLRSKGGGLSRGTGLKRGKAIKRKPPRRLAGPGSDPAYLDAVRKLPCCAPRISLVGPEALLHFGPIHAHHAGRRPGTGMKAPDDTAIALCAKHHAHWHAGLGVFLYWTKEDRRTWADAAIEDTRGLVAEARPA